VNVGDDVTFTMGGQSLPGKILQVHGEKVRVELTEMVMPYTKGHKFGRSFSDILSVAPKPVTEQDITMQQHKLQVLLKASNTVWNSAQVHGISEEGYVISVDGKPPTTHPFATTKLIEDLPPKFADVRVMIYVLCKKEQQWELGVVIEITQSNLICVHMHSGAEAAVSIQQLRVITARDEDIKKSLSSKLLFLAGFKSVAAKDGEGKNGTAKSKEGSSSSVSQEQFNETIIHLFEQADVDNSGELSYDEVKEMSASMGLIMNNKAWQKLLTEMDEDGNGSISKSELVNFWSKWYLEKGPGASLQQSDKSSKKSTLGKIVSSIKSKVSDKSPQQQKQEPTQPQQQSQQKAPPKTQQSTTSASAKTAAEKKQGFFRSRG